MKYGSGYFPINDTLSNGGIINSKSLVQLAYIIHLEVKEIHVTGDKAYKELLGWSVEYRLR